MLPGCQPFLTFPLSSCFFLFLDSLIPSPTLPLPSLSPLPSIVSSIPTYLLSLLALLLQPPNPASSAHCLPSFSIHSPSSDPSIPSSSYYYRHSFFSCTGHSSCFASPLSSLFPSLAHLLPVRLPASSSFLTADSSGQSHFFPLPILSWVPPSCPPRIAGLPIPGVKPVKMA